MKRGLIIVGVCLVLLMSLSIVSAGFHWGTTGNAVKKIKDGDEINLYSGIDEQREFVLNGKEYRLQAFEINSEVAVFDLYDNSDSSDQGEGFIFTAEDSKYVSQNSARHPVKIELKYIAKAWWNGKYRARLKISKAEGILNENSEEKVTLCDTNSCLLNEGYILKKTYLGKEYSIKIDYLDSNEVKLNVNGEILKSLNFNIEEQDIQYYAELGIQLISIQISSDVERYGLSFVELKLIPPSPNDVTYEGVLEMLESCSLVTDTIYDEDSTQSCYKLCRGHDKRCISSFFFLNRRETNNVINFPLQCNTPFNMIVDNSGGDLICMCCSSP